MPDVYFFPTDDGGNVNITTGGDLELHTGFEVAVYLSIVGGNVEDDGRVGNPNAYWQNLIEPEEAFKLISRTQFMLGLLSITGANLQRIRRAAVDDLAWFLKQGIASKVDVQVSLGQVNRVRFDITITAEGVESRFTFTLLWKAAGQ